ncbi:microviridin/marinostatin family tricyclic proteinase inhibitor [Sorangium sp. So ce296]|uniref:Microviridin/marinostatin family tricyclic proteinase inhibitor n=1 Tax=Sorangium cellulosum TaxID=56 RepID=A0A150T4F2_SORCE|nr:hypothetical protein BE20_42975 [Sorangium cellulosum]KYF99519.1 hypothetical protein BE18_11230 [Sorangium cellulosum]
MADIDRDPEQVPFFARFLEDQKRVRTGVKAGGCVTTMKFPSDGEDTGGGEAVTLKFPSDNDEDLGVK